MEVEFLEVSLSKPSSLAACVEVLLYTQTS